MNKQQATQIIEDVLKIEKNFQIEKELTDSEFIKEQLYRQ